MKTEDVFEIIKANPGVTGADIWRALIARSWSAKRFGKDSLITALFGPSVGSVYVHLARLENAKRIRSHWGPATLARGGHRPRHYFPVEI
jgi:hypothetical protein